MAQARSQRMGIVLQLAERAENSAAEVLQSLKAQLEASKQQLQQLIEYQQEYIDQINAKTSQTAREMISDRSFIGQLEEASVAQRQKLTQQHKDCDQAMSAWQAAYQKRKNIADLIEKMKQSETAALEKVLQKELDELSSQAFQRKS